jgi:hypothetical protein
MTEAVSLISFAGQCMPNRYVTRISGRRNRTPIRGGGKIHCPLRGKADEQNITRPRDAKSKCREYIATRYTFQYKTTDTAVEASSLENRLKPGLNP